MKRLTMLVLVATLVTTHAVAQEKAAKKPPAGSSPGVELKTTRDQASYAIGMNIARNMKKDGLELSVNALVQGLVDVFNNAQPRLTDAQCQAALEALDQEIQAKMAGAGEKNKKEGQAFLAANKQKEGVVTLPSGLQYKVLKTGKGPSPKLTDTVRTHYEGTLINGTVFDSSIERNEPAEFPVNGVIRGWTEALQRMKVGDKWRLFVPSELAYGAQGAPPAIAPHSVLIFDVELLAIPAQ